MDLVLLFVQILDFPQQTTVRHLQSLHLFSKLILFPKSFVFFPFQLLNKNSLDHSVIDALKFGLFLDLSKALFAFQNRVEKRVWGFGSGDLLGESLFQADLPVVGLMLKRVGLLLGKKGVLLSKKAVSALRVRLQRIYWTRLEVSFRSNLVFELIQVKKRIFSLRRVLIYDIVQQVGILFVAPIDLCARSLNEEVVADTVPHLIAVQSLLVLGLRHEIQTHVFVDLVPVNPLLNLLLVQQVEADIISDLVGLNFELDARLSHQVVSNPPLNIFSLVSSLGLLRLHFV